MSTATMAELRAIQAPQPREATLPAVRAGFFDLQSFELIQRVSKAFATSELVPKAYQGNVANCMIALNLAQRLGADPLMVMQNLVIVHGRPTWSAQFLIATANMCGRFTALRFEFFGDRGKDSWGCRAWANEKSTGEKLVGSDVSIAIAKSEGWYSKNGSKWQSIPQQMLMYRAGAWWVRAYAPELSMGLMTADEAGDVIELTQGADGTYTVTTEDIAQAVRHEQQDKHQPADATPAPTYAQVRDAIERATDTDALDVAADLIGAVADEQQRAELVEVLNERRAKVGG